MVRNTLHHSQKGENGQALAGAVFAVTADDTGEQVGTITTDENSVGTITGFDQTSLYGSEIPSSNRLCSLRRTYQDCARFESAAHETGNTIESEVTVKANR